MTRGDLINYIEIGIEVAQKSPSRIVTDGTPWYKVNPEGIVTWFEVIAKRWDASQKRKSK